MPSAPGAVKLFLGGEMPRPGATARVSLFGRRAARYSERPRMEGGMRHILIIGMGGIGRHVAHALQNEATRVRLSILVRSQYVREVKARVEAVAPGTCRWSTSSRSSPTSPSSRRMRGHAAVAEFGETCLTSGADFLVSSVGALTDANLLHRLERASRTHIGR